MEDDIYMSLRSDDHSEVVMKLYEKIKLMPFVIYVEQKSEEESDVCRKQGNEAFKLHCYRDALKFYNKALCYAPKDSRSLNLAYSNRSALLYEIGEFHFALKDIKICYRLGCPDDILRKLKVREKKCYQQKQTNYVVDVTKKMISSANCLYLGADRSNEIPCASRAVKLDTAGPQSRVIAAEDIDVGTVVASEMAFVNTSANNEGAYLQCYHCVKSSLNLIPCNNCCSVMFCDENCKNMSIDEYHGVECKLLDRRFTCMVNSALKAVIKMKNKCKSWDEFIKASNEIIKINQTQESLQHMKLFSDINPFSLLHNTKNTYVPFGKKIERAIITTLLIECLEDRRSYFPTAQKEKLLAIRATANLLMHLFLYSREIILKQIAVVSAESMESVHYFTHGFYIFLGNLEHSCHPNLIVTAMNNKAVLTAIQPIQRGAPLTISYVGHYLLRENLNIELNIYGALGIVCSCKVCTNKWGEVFAKDYKLSPAQEEYLREIDLENILRMHLHHGVVGFYRKLCQGLKVFADLPNTMEYKKVFMAFIQYLDMYCCIETDNKILGDK
ncbi:SET and MYND domain-containing protein 4 [Eumeta japonica]|uniref:SET and MYND domain-containing protein 4 n=1 Tax=Eumeta variegata TaxID=151549 RepID=A0A4C1XT14_EUMVA|nr:SET and MYND domain-containing protein 4 [Eumeta japonica]